MYKLKENFDQLKMRRFQKGIEQVLRQQDKTFQQDRQHCCFAQIWFLLGRTHLHCMQQGRD
jgi:hypothetical protein